MQHSQEHTQMEAHNFTSKPAAVQEVEGGSDTWAKQHIYVASPPLCYDFINEVLFENTREFLQSTLTRAQPSAQ